jgi:hypothetical protein
MAAAERLHEAHLASAGKRMRHTAGDLRGNAIASERDEIAGVHKISR